MATESFGLSELFEKAFGYKSEAFNPSFPEAVGYNQWSPGMKGYREGAGCAGNAPLYSNTGELGREYYLPVYITYPGYDKEKGSWSATGEKIELPYPVVSISSKKKIVETELTEGNRGTFRELINQGDYEIGIKGLCIAKNNEFPEELITDLRKLYECGSAVTIENGLTDIFLIRPTREGRDSIVIKEISFPEVRGVKNVWAYELACVSDAPFSLKEIK